MIELTIVKCAHTALMLCWTFSNRVYWGKNRGNRPVAFVAKGE